MKIWHISDTHGNHEKLKVPDVDLIIHSGDATNWQNRSKNLEEMLDFLRWFEQIRIPKIYIAGNHDTSIESKIIDKEYLSDLGIIYLENESVEFKGVNIYGSPYSPTFGIGWAFNKARHKIHEVWDEVPEDTDILVTHSPPLGILDLTENRDRTFEMCGDKNLYKQITQRIKPKLHLFGHIHNRTGATYHNSGTKQVAGVDTLFSNAAISIDGKMNSICSNGNILEIDV